MLPLNAALYVFSKEVIGITMMLISEFEWLNKLPKIRRDKAGLFEAIMNSGIACKSRMSVEGDSYCPEIKIIFDKSNRIVKISDNGEGISLGKIKTLLSRIGVTTNTENICQLLIDNNIEEKPSDPFRGWGIVAILSGFTYVRIMSHNINESSGVRIDLDSENESIKLFSINMGDFKETSFIFDYDEFLKVWGNSYEVKELLDMVNMYHGDIDISLVEVDSTSIGAKYPPSKVKELKQSISLMEREGNIDKFVGFLKQDNRTLSNRDLLRLDEKHYKFKLLSLFGLHSDYSVISETEVDDGYIDILLKKKNSSIETCFEWLIELKYVKNSDANNINKIREDGIEQARSYAKSRIIVETMKANTLKTVVLTFLGKTEVFVDYV